MDVESSQDATVKDLILTIKHAVHDLRSPLSALQMLCRCSKSLSPKEQSLLKDCTERMLQILTLVAKNINGKQDRCLEIFEKININTVVQKIIQEKKIEYHDLEVDFIYSSVGAVDNLTIDGSITDFERMLSNLINNAVESCYVKAKITVILELKDQVLQLKILDNGRGITADVLQKLRHGVTITSGKENGQGIGFQQIRKTVTKLNGKLTIDSMIGVGSSIGLEFALN